MENGKWKIEKKTLKHLKFHHFLKIKKCIKI